jgi:DNA-binding CsgD family transcriptional regulator
LLVKFARKWNLLSTAKTSARRLIPHSIKALTGRISSSTIRVRSDMVSLIRDVYSAAADETRWPAVLERLADEYRGDVAGLQYRVGTEGHITSSRWVRFDPALQVSYRTYFATRNPWTRLSQPLYRPGFVYTPERYLPLRELQRTEFYDGILRPLNVAHCFGACVFKRGDDALSFTVVRSRTRGHYEERELDQVRAILPHLRRAIQVNERLAQLEHNRTSLGGGLDSLRHGVIVVDRSGRVIFANRVANLIVALNDGLTIAKDGLVASARADRSRLRLLLDRAVRTTAGEGFESGGAMTVSRPSMKRSFFVLVAPLKLTRPGCDPSGMATIFVSDPEIRIETIEDVARRTFGLTKAEARVANAFASSDSLDQAAQTLRVTRETIRWHLRQLYRKTGTNRQTGLLRRLAAGPARLHLDALQ